MSHYQQTSLLFSLEYKTDCCVNRKLEDYSWKELSLELPVTTDPPQSASTEYLICLLHA